MQSIFQKIVGWVLVAVGIIIIFWSISSAFSTFTGKKEAPNVFEVKKEGSECPPCAASQGTQEQIQAQVEKMLQGQVKEQIQEFLPPDFISKVLNLGVYGALIALLIFAGGKVSGIGIKLLRDGDEK
jgi:flagellar basal body-associated protein FliL